MMPKHPNTTANNETAQRSRTELDHDRKDARHATPSPSLGNISPDGAVVALRHPDDRACRLGGSDGGSETRKSRPSHHCLGRPSAEEPTLRARLTRVADVDSACAGNFLTFIGIA